MSNASDYTSEIQLTKVIPEGYMEADYIKNYENVVGDLSKLPNFSKLPFYVINLKRRTDRLEQTRAQLGDTFHRVEACDGNELQYYNLNDQFRVNKARKIYHVPFARKQIGATLSHYRIYQQVAQDTTIGEDDWVLIAEDDNNYVVDFARKLDQIIEHLKDPHFDAAKIVVLKHFEMAETMDYFPYLCAINRKQGRPEIKDCEQKLREQGIFNPELFAVTCKYRFHANLESEPERAFSFEYEGVKPSPYPNLYSNKQTLFHNSYIRPYSSSLYLIRRRVCIETVKRHPRPFWFADDFKQFVAPQHVLYASPYLACEPDYENESSILDELSYHVYHYNRINRFYNHYTSFWLRHVRFLALHTYSQNYYLRFQAGVLQRLLGIYIP